MSKYSETTGNFSLIKSITPPMGNLLLRKCACGQHTGRGSECEECKKKGEDTLQRAAVNNSLTHEVPPIVHEVLRSPGQPLDAQTRSFMEARFEHDFSNVRVHTDARAAESARAVNALAYTVGQEVVFGEGQYLPATLTGKSLIAHELVHTLQQGISSPVTNGRLTVGSGNGPEEQQAARIGRNIEQHVALSGSGVQSGNNMDSINRQATPDAQERPFWLDLGKQPNYGILPKDRRTPMISKRRANEILPPAVKESLDEVGWTIEASFVRADKMRTFLQSHFGADKDLRVTSIVKPGEHTTYRKMDVVRAGTTTWEELAAAAVHAGFWVHAEGLTLYGKFWPLSPKATGPHLDLYLINTQMGDFPIPKDVLAMENGETTRLT